MNLNAYDKMEVVTKQPYIDVIHKKLNLYNIPYRKYYAFLKRYDQKEKVNQIFVVLTDYQNNDIQYHSVFKKSEHTIRLDLSYIWNEGGFNSIKSMTNVYFNKTEEQEDGEIYEIVI